MRNLEFTDKLGVGLNVPSESDVSDLEFKSLLHEAIDPATPLARLIELMEQNFLDEVLQNPALPLLVMEQPDLWELLDVNVRLNIARSPRCPIEFASWAVRSEIQHSLIVMNLTIHPALPVPLRRQAYMQTPALHIAHWMLDGTRLVGVLTEAEMLLLRRGGIEAHRPGNEPDPSLTGLELEQLAQLGMTGRYLARNHPQCSPELREQLLREARQR